MDLNIHFYKNFDIICAGVMLHLSENSIMIKKRLDSKEMPNHACFRHVKNVGRIFRHVKYREHSKVI